MNVQPTDKQTDKNQSNGNNWKRQINKLKLMKGYERDPITGLYTQSALKKQRMIAPPCNCKRSKKNGVLQC